VAEKIRNSPVVFSIIFTLLISILWGATTIFLQGLLGYETQMPPLIITGIFITFTVVAVVLLGIINRINGFKHVFKVKGFIKGLLVLIPAMAFFAFGLAINASGDANVNVGDIWNFSLTALMEAAAALMANVLFRGLFVTALFIKLSRTKSERVKSVFIASALYLVIYIPLSILNTGSIEPMQLINTFVVGLGFCAAYMYSKNLMSLVAVQGVWQILGSAFDFFGIGENVQVVPTPLLFIVLAAILISIVVFAVIFSRRAEPFRANDNVMTTIGGD